MNRFVVRGAVVGAIALAVILTIGYTAEQALAGPVIPVGSVIVGTGSGLYSEFSPTGTLLGQFDTTSGSADETGCGFDASGNLFGTNFDTSSTSKFDPTGALLVPSFGTGFDAHPESVTFDLLGNVYFGQADGLHKILEFNSAGTPVASFSPATEDRGTDWIELQTDQCTILYTSEGPDILSFNKCTNTQGANFNVAPLPGGSAFAHRTLLNGDVLVADSTEVTLLNTAGVQIQHYPITGQTFLFALNLDPDGTSFWTADLITGEVFKVDIATGGILESWFPNTAPGFTATGGLCVKGENTVSNPLCTATALISGSMEGNLPVKPGDTIKAGYDFTVPGNHPVDMVSFTNVSVMLSVKCPNNSVVPITITMPNQTYTDPAGSPNWIPSGDQKSPLVYQGSFTVPAGLCGGQTGHAPQGATFSANLTGTTKDAVHVRFHYSDNTSGSWSSTPSYCGGH
jgi:hypothetical protein